MPDQELCKNCLEPLCECAEIRPQHHTKDLDFSEANDLCTRTRVVRWMSGCRGCLLRVVSVCPFVGWLPTRFYEQTGQHPSDCPFFTDGQPNAGIRFIAELPAKEEG